MTADTGSAPAGTTHGDDENLTPDLSRARADLIAAIVGSGQTSEDRDPELVKPGEGGFSFELRFNGESIPLDGNDVNQLSADEFQPFLERHRQQAETGAYDDALRAALEKEGPAKASARVRGVGAAGAEKTAPQ